LSPLEGVFWFTEMWESKYEADKDNWELRASNAAQSEATAPCANLWLEQPMVWEPREVALGQGCVPTAMSTTLRPLLL